MKRQGSIQKKGDTYYAVFAVGGKRKWIRGGKTKKDAEKVLNENLYELDSGTYKSLPRTTFGQFADFWTKTYVEPNLKPSTVRSYGLILNGFSSFNDRQLADITTGALQGHVSDRLKVVGSKTVCNELVVLKLLFKHARKWGYLKLDPAKDVDRPKRKKTFIDLLTPSEVNAFLSTTDLGNYRVAFLTDVVTGLRAGELWGLQWGDIDWTSKQIHVRRSVWRKRFQTPKSDYSIRKVDVPESLLSELRAWKLACPISENDLVFPSREGKVPDHDNVVKRHFAPALRRAGLRQVSFHSLRHTNASIRIEAGQNIKYISKQLGHSSIQITMDIYGHLFNDTDFARQQVELLETSFQSVRKPLESTPEDSKRGLQESHRNLVIA